MIGSLATRVRELSLRVAQLEGELEAARRRIAVYEDFDAQVQESLAAALRAANQVRERARVSAEAIAQEARAQRPDAVAELESIRIERDALRRAIDDASITNASAPVVAAFPMSEMRTAATDALRGVFKELVAELRATATPAVQTVESPSPRPANSPAPFVAPSSAYVSPAQQPSSTTPPPPSNITTPAVAAPAAQQSWSQPAPAPQRPYVAPPSSYNIAPAQPVPRPMAVPQAPRPEPAAIVEDVDVTPTAAAPAPAAAEPGREQWTGAPGEPVGEVQVVLSPIASFPRLVELERRLQGMAVVRTVYARDFRNGVATLAIGLRHPMTVDEFATAVTKLEYPRLRIVSTSGYVLELRIDTEASSIA